MVKILKANGSQLGEKYNIYKTNNVWFTYQTLITANEKDGGMCNVIFTHRRRYLFYN